MPKCKSCGSERQRRPWTANDTTCPNCLYRQEAQQEADNEYIAHMQTYNTAGDHRVLRAMGNLRAALP